MLFRDLLNTEIPGVSRRLLALDGADFIRSCAGRKRVPALARGDYALSLRARLAGSEPSRATLSGTHTEPPRRLETLFGTQS
jgi:hypothetical protein